MPEHTVLITGCSSGIGRASAEAFLEEEWTVYATARDTEDIADLAEQGCETAELDVTEQADIDRVVERIVDDTGRIDCLVNNAGYAQFGPIEDVPVERVHDQFDVNVYGPHRLTRAVLPHMRDREDGTIVNLSSVAGRVSSPGMGTYSASKAAVESMSEALRVEVEEYDIDVVLVEPGPVDTQFSDRADDEFASLDRSGAYPSIYKLYQDQQLFGGSSVFGIPAAQVADVVVNAASATEPEPRYVVGEFARLTVLSRFLPDRIRDAGFRALRKVLG
jgi:NAD(P)-dependent dehydrogenase (short-subunit alcohol dehydrogenase family)